MTSSLIGALFAWIFTLAASSPALRDHVDPSALHPHHPKALIAGCAAGQAKLLYFTVPYNEKHLQNVDDGFEWHLGFASFVTEVPLHTADGSVAVPPGAYKFNARFDKASGHWRMVLVNREWSRARSNLRRAKARLKRARATEEDVQKAQAAHDAVKQRIDSGDLIAEHIIPLTAREQAHEEHMAMAIHHRGYATQRVGSEVATGGAEFSVLVDFGDLHYTADFREDWKKPEAMDGEEKK